MKSRHSFSEKTTSRNLPPTLSPHPMKTNTLHRPSRLQASRLIISCLTAMTLTSAAVDVAVMACFTREHPQSAQDLGHERPALLSRSRHQARGCGLCPDLEQKNLSNSPSISRLYTGKGFLGPMSRPPASFYSSRKWIWPSPCGKATPPSRFLRQRHLGFLPKLCLWGSIAGV